MSPYLWYKSEQRLKLGDVCRYTVEYTTEEPEEETVYIRVKNTEKTGLRAVNMLIGPLVLYCHVVPFQYSHRREFLPENAEENREVCFRNTMQPGQTFNVKLVLNKNSLRCANSDGSRTYQWECQVTSQILINLRSSVSFIMAVGSDLTRMRRATRSVLTSFSKGDFSPAPEDENDLSEWETSYNPGLRVKLQKTDDLWPTVPKSKHSPIHLVIITHGIFSNLTADMLYVRDAIAKTAENIVVSGFRGNAGRTEKGIHRLGVNVSHFVMDLIEELQTQYTVGSISFVAHSLGGPVQLYALKHLLSVKGTDYFEKQQIRLCNFVCLASPMLGVLSEMSLWISWFLDLGTLGKTGRDLTLSKKSPRYLRHLSQSKRDSFRPLLETLPDEPIRSLLKKFDSRVVYANAVHDGIVPLRTSALLYLDWEALGDVTAMKKDEKVLSPANSHNKNGGASHHGESAKTEITKGKRAKTESTNAESAETETTKTESTQTENPQTDSPQTETTNGVNANGETANAKVANGSADAEVTHESPNTEMTNESAITGSTNEESSRGDNNVQPISTAENEVGEIPADEPTDIKTNFDRIFSSLFSSENNEKGNGEPEPPKKSRRIQNKIRKYARISAKGSDVSSAPSNSPEQESYESDAEDGELKSLNIPPKASAVESVVNTLLCPVPSENFITTPEDRTPVIFHDKYYHFDSVPGHENDQVKGIKKLFHFTDWKIEKQVRIARKYHVPELSWRKVLVFLPPDAHNNIVVRRRFANGYGWGVIDHLTDEVFAQKVKAKM